MCRQKTDMKKRRNRIFDLDEIIKQMSIHYFNKESIYSSLMYSENFWLRLPSEN